MNGYLILAMRDLPGGDRFANSRLRGALPVVAGGLVGAVVGGAHPILGALFGSAIVKSAVDVATGESTAAEAARRLRSHAVATVGALAVPFAPMVGYCAGVVADHAVFGAARPPSLDDVRAGRATIKRGDKGDRSNPNDPVVYVQGIAGAVADGDFGPNTENAVTAFQLAHRLGATGVVDQKTLAVMDALAAGGGSGGVASVEVSKQVQGRRSSVSLPDSGASSMSVVWDDGTPVRVGERVYSKEGSGVVAAVDGNRSVRFQWDNGDSVSLDVGSFGGRLNSSWRRPLNVASVSTSSVRVESGFLSALKRPLWMGSPIAVWQGALLGIGGAALLGAVVSLALPSTG